MRYTLYPTDIRKLPGGTMASPFGNIMRMKEAAEGKGEEMKIGKKIFYLF